MFKPPCCCNTTIVETLIILQKLLGPFSFYPRSQRQIHTDLCANELRSTSLASLFSQIKRTAYHFMKVCNINVSPQKGLDRTCPTVHGCNLQTVPLYNCILFFYNCLRCSLAKCNVHIQSSDSIVLITCCRLILYLKKFLCEQFTHPP